MAVGAVTLDMLLQALLPHLSAASDRGAWPVMVAGHGALHAVTHGRTEDGSGVVVLYVEAPVAAPVPMPTGDVPLPFDVEEWGR